MLLSTLFSSMSRCLFLCALIMGAGLVHAKCKDGLVLVNGAETICMADIPGLLNIQSGQMSLSDVAFSHPTLVVSAAGPQCGGVVGFAWGAGKSTPSKSIDYCERNLQTKLGKHDVQRMGCKCEVFLVPDDAKGHFRMLKPHVEFLSALQLSVTTVASISPKPTEVQAATLPTPVVQTMAASPPSIVALRPTLASATVTPLAQTAPVPTQPAAAVPATVVLSPPQVEPPRSTIALSLSSSQPNVDGVVTLTITTNSDTASLRINGDEAGGRIDGRYSINRFAQLGNNVFEIVATDRFGNTQRKSLTVTRRATDNTVLFAALNPIAVRARPATNAVAIIIGIQDYRRVPKAEFANNDARAFYDYAIRGLGVRPENIKILLDQDADDVEILGAFKNWLPLKSRRGQTDVYVFFSGHGMPSDDGSNLYMLPHGVDRQFLDRTAIKQSELIASLQAVSPKSVTMFMDACYSGQIRTGETLLASARPIAIQPKASSFPANFNVISASAPDQLASSSPDLKHGVFSYFLMKGMEGEADENKDGNITMDEMQTYLKENVGKKAMSLNRTQEPQLSGDRTRVLVGR